MGVGTKIKAILKEQKKTIKQLAEESGVPLNTLYSITKRDSKVVSDPVLEKISNALGVSKDIFIPSVVRESAWEFAEQQAQQNQVLEKRGLLNGLPEEQRKSLTNAADIYQRELSRVINTLEASTWVASKNAVAQETLRVFQTVTDYELEGRLRGLFGSLNRMGKLQAVFSLEKLSDPWPPSPNGGTPTASAALWAMTARGSR